MQDSSNIATELEIANKAIARLRAGIMATVFGMTGGTVLFLATIWLLIQGGPNTGQHLSLLENYFVGYSVSWGGSVIGFFYGALAGGVIGWLIAWIYNRIVDLRPSDSQS